MKTPVQYKKKSSYYIPLLGPYNHCIHWGKNKEKTYP